MKKEINLGIGNYYGSVFLYKEKNKYYMSIQCQIYSELDRLEISKITYDELVKSIKNIGV